MKRRNWTLEDVGKHWDRTEDYDDINKKTYSYFRRFTDGYKMSDIKDNAYTLDICCRTGNGTSYFSSKKNIRAVCMDVSDKMLKIAAERLRAENVDFTVKRFDTHNLPAEDNTFDEVLCFETIEHIPDPEKFIKELSRVTKKGGEVIITMPNVLWEPVHAFAAVTGIHHSEGPHKFIPRREILKTLRRYNLGVKREKTTVLVAYGPKFLTSLGELIEKNLPELIRRVFCLRRVFICEKL